MTSNDKISFRCLALTGSFETSAPPPDCFSGLTGDFDQQGISFGALQWNLGQGSLQPLLTEMISTHGPVIATIFKDKFDGLKKMLSQARPEQMAWARSVQGPNFRVAEPWKAMFVALGQTREFQAIQVSRVEKTSTSARQLSQRFDLNTERGHALMFDILTQNGSISTVVEARIRTDYETITATSPIDVEVARLRIIANRRAEASKPTFIEDVRRRKLCIANGEGTVHGSHYNLQQQFAIGLRPVAF